MARILALTGALARSRVRELRGLEGALSNNFVVFALLLLALQPRGNTFLPILAAVLLFIPLCTGPLLRIPEERLQLLPLTPGDLLALRAAGLLLAPPLWIAGALLVLGGRDQRWAAFLVLVGGAAVNAAAVLGNRLLRNLPALDPFRWIPAFPGPLGGLVRKNLRELLRSLDTALAVSLSLIGVLFRLLSPGPFAEVGFGCALLVVLALSTGTQDLFAAEGRSGLERCRLLLAKDLAFLGLVLVLTLPLAPMAGLGAAMGALLTGHQGSVAGPRARPRRGFSAGRASALGLVQVVLLLAGALVGHRSSPLWLLPLACALAISLAFHGRRLEA